MGGIAYVHVYGLQYRPDRSFSHIHAHLSPNTDRDLQQLLTTAMPGQAPGDLYNFLEISTQCCNREMWLVSAPLRPLLCSPIFPSVTFS